MDRVGLRALLGLGAIHFIVLKILERRHMLAKAVRPLQRLERGTPMVEPDLTETLPNHMRILEIESGPGERARFCTSPR